MPRGMKTHLIAFIIFMGTAIVLLSLKLSSAQEQPIVNTIEIRGLKRIEEGAIRQQLSQKTGHPLSGENIEHDIKNIYKMGYFEDVQVEAEPFEGGLKLFYLVKEKPTIVRVSFYGNEEFEDDKLREQIRLMPGAISDVTLIQDNVFLLKAFYESEGYWLAHIVPVVKRITPNEVRLTFLIEEGEKVKIKHIIIEGNDALSDGKIKKVMETKSWWILSFLFSTGYYQKSTMDADVVRIRDLYFNNGYLNVKVSQPELKLTPDKRQMTISLGIDEGPQFTVSSIGFKGHELTDDQLLGDLLSLKEGEVFSKKKLQEGIQGIVEYYSERGYALALVEPDVVTDDKTLTVSIVMNVDEGDIYRIGRIEIMGNTKTMDKVIRREVRLDEGDIFNSRLLKRSYERLNNLNFFEIIDLVPKPLPKEKKIDLDVKVKEKATGFLSVGGGYSTVDKLVFLVDLTQGNLFGTGRYAKIKAEIGSRSSLYELSYRDPWFLDKRISLTVSAYKTERDYVSYDRRSTGGSIGFGKRFAEYWSGSLTYRIERVEIFNVEEDTSTIVQEQVGTTTTSSITPGLIRDSRDSFIDPTRGSRSSLFVTYAGIGGDNFFVKGVFDSAWFFPIGKTTFALRGRYGYATGLFNEELPLYERFYIGGISTIRGLGFGEGGPRDENEDVIGGTSQIIVNTEYIFPIFSELKLKGVVFFDAGRAYDDSETFGTDIRYTAGGGLRWISPMGPLRIEYGYNFDRREDEDTGKIEFSIGGSF
jgi:outer membrane protein insertion porin family